MHDPLQHTKLDACYVQRMMQRDTLWAAHLQQSGGLSLILCHEGVQIALCTVCDCRLGDRDTSQDLQAV